MQTLYFYLRLNGASATVVDSNNSFVGNQLPAFTRGQQITLDIGLFEGSSTTELAQADVQALADSFGFTADTEYAQATPAIIASSVSVGTDGHLSVVLTTTNSERMQSVKGTTKTQVHCALAGTASGSTQPVFAALFDMIVLEPVSTSGLA